MSDEPGQNVLGLECESFSRVILCGVFNQLTFALTQMECDLEICVQTLQKKIFLFFLNSQMATILVVKTEKRKLTKIMFEI